MSDHSEQLLQGAQKHKAWLEQEAARKHEEWLEHQAALGAAYAKIASDPDDNKAEIANLIDSITGDCHAVITVEDATTHHGIPVYRATHGQRNYTTGDVDCVTSWAVQVGEKWELLVANDGTGEPPPSGVDAFGTAEGAAIYALGLMDVKEKPF